MEGTDIDEVASDLLNILNEAACKVNILCRNSKKKKSSTCNTNEWFDQDLRVKRKTLLSKGALLSKFPFDPIVRGAYFKCYRESNKLRKYKKRNFRQTILDSLDQLRDTDPKKYWKLIKSLKEDSESDSTNSVEPEQWFQYFTELNQKPSSIESKLNYINSKVKDMENMKHFCELDFLISSKEISDGISKLKSDKASGLDGIPNEMLKAGSSILTPMLQKLFNFIFSSGQYPVQWSSAYLSPVFKSGDVSKPENYRGIAINSCIAKLFNTVLNNRFDKFLEEHKIISRFQIGFAKKSRTTDHMFVLKTLIDKYINKKGGKLFAFFVDFRRAFDTIIHEGIKYKLLKSGIGGNFYSIIKDMYSKNDLCVKIGSEITLFFKSYIGVRQGLC